jgi:hypothetical protein
MARRRVVVIEEEYRVIRHSPPPLPPPKRDSGGDGGGGWFATAVGFGLCFLIAVGIQKLTDGHASPSPVVKETGRRVIVASNIEGERCLAPGSVNGVPATFMVDTGAPTVAEFSSSWADKLGVKNLQYRELWPGTRYGKIATATVHEIRVGDVVWKDAAARFYSDWAYSFGGDTRPLLGLAALNARGINVEFERDTCRLTVSR